MARMSAEKRIELGTAMVTLWSEKGCESDRSVRFVSDMIVRLEAGRGLTKRQREWFDSAVVTEPPAPKNQKMVERLLRAADTAGMEKGSQPLRDFAYKLSRGWNLSEKQTSFMNKLLDQAEDIQKNGRWVPTDDEKKQIEMGVHFCRRYSPYFFSGRPGVSRAHSECKSWIQGDLDYLDKWSAGKMIEICKGDREKMTDAFSRWPIGELATLRSGKVGLVLDAPFVGGKGKPVLNILVEGIPKEVTLDKIKKTRRTKKKVV